MKKSNDDFELNNFEFESKNLELDFDLLDFDLIDEEQLNSRIFKPKISKKSLSQCKKYSHAIEAAENVDLSIGCYNFLIVNGNFYFGDFIKSLVEKRHINPKKIYISTLSLNKSNVDALESIIKMSKLKEINVILSDYFYSHEKNFLVPYLYEKLDFNNIFQMAFCSTHCKICLIETYSNQFYVIHGSANLRSNGNIEQFCVEENKALFDFNRQYMDDIISQYFTINKKIQSNCQSIRGKKLWKIIEGV